MKRVIAWTILIMYLNASAQTLLPMVRDIVAHTFFWHEHLEHVHHGHHGSQHVHHEMASLAQQSQDDPHSHPTFSFSQDVLSAHLVPAFTSLQTSIPEIHTSACSFWLFLFPEAFLSVFSPPPDLT